jgi:hypothetical protein
MTCPLVRGSVSLEQPREATVDSDNGDIGQNFKSAREVVVTTIRDFQQRHCMFCYFLVSDASLPASISLGILTVAE